MLHWSHVTCNCDSLGAIGRAPSWTCSRTEVILDWTWAVRRSQQWRDYKSVLRSLWNSSWCCAGSQSWVSDKTKGAGTGTVALLNSHADSEASCSGAAAAGWPGLVALVRHCCSADEFNYDFFLKLPWNHDIPHDILHYIFRHCQYNFFHEKGPKFIKFSLNSWKTMNSVYQEVYWQTIHINVHIRTHGKYEFMYESIWFQVYPEVYCQKNHINKFMI